MLLVPFETSKLSFRLECPNSTPWTMRKVCHKCHAYVTHVGPSNLYARSIVESATVALNTWITIARTYTTASAKITGE